MNDTIRTSRTAGRGLRLSCQRGRLEPGAARGSFGKGLLRTQGRAKPHADDGVIRVTGDKQRPTPGSFQRFALNSSAHAGITTSVISKSTGLPCREHQRLPVRGGQDEIPADAQRALPKTANALRPDQRTVSLSLRHHALTLSSACASISGK